ncbi:MAG: NADPH:quinone oxidoreductase family protein [Gammaproteobacteria bacterium]|nr:NADPH:quinone oxidoreductase family protein [Gammaproteobacteria bacterium]
MIHVKSYRCHNIAEDVGTIQLDEIELADPGPDEIQVQVKACAANFTDILMIQDKYQFHPPRPFAPGGEGSGVVAKVGVNVSTWKEGDAVVFGGRYGGFTEAVNLPAVVARPLPKHMNFAQGASYSTAYSTAWVALSHRGNLQADEWLLVHGATGGVGLAAVDIGKLLGAQVIATGGRDDKLEVVKSRGADEVINYTLPDGSMGGFRERVKEITGTGGADVIYDPVGGDVFDESLRCVNFGGRILTIGFTSGRWPTAPVNLILIKMVSLIGVRAGEIGRRNPALGAKFRAELNELAESGKITPYVCKGFPLEQAVDALRMLENRDVVGKCVVTMNDYELEEITV